MRPDCSPVKGARLVSHDISFVFPGFYPYEFTSVREETRAARETAWIGVYLSSMDGMGSRTDLKGPDAVKALNIACANRDFHELEVGKSRHAISVDEEGFLAASGCVLKMAEDHFYTSCMFTLQATIDKHGLDATFEPVREYFIQIDGPKSLEILEDAVQADLHDLKFGQNKWVKICGTDMLVYRLGMSGSLGYEVHGDYENFDIVYDAIVASGEKFGAKRQGIRNYGGANHTPGGFPNQLVHFAFSDGTSAGTFPPLPLTGSAAGDIKNYFVTPFDCGWGSLVKFDHEYTGRAALERLAEGNARTCVTLEWNLDDVAALLKGEIDGSVAADEELMAYNVNNPEMNRYHMDLVAKDGAVVGTTGGRVRDYWFNKFLSLAFVGQDVAAEGDELAVLWGKADGPQVPIRATVAKYPYFDGEWRNETCDVNALVPKRF